MPPGNADARGHQHDVGRLHVRRTCRAGARQASRIGGLIAFVYGWMNAKAWNIQQVMMIWTGCVIVQIIVSVIGAATGAMNFNFQFGQMQGL